jgi:hypothetical protein
MSREAARLEVVALVQSAVAAWAAWPVFVDWENRAAVNFATQTKPYLAVDIVYYDGRQADLADNPYVRSFGNVLLAVMTPAGTGVSDSNRLIDHVSKALQMRDVPGLHTKAARPLPPVEPLGWHGTMAAIDFWHDDLSQ